MPMLKEALRGSLSEREIALLSSSFDVLGTIAILKVPEELKDKENLIGSEILSRVKNLRTVLNQVSDVGGEFRTRELKVIAGVANFETIYKESGCAFKVNVRDVYFSPRLSTERERIAGLVSEGERVLNMFAGIGTFSIIMAKRVACVVDSVDKNPAAIELAVKSLRMNKLRGLVKPILSDAADYALEHEASFDRVLMPLPERADEFLRFAIRACKDGGIVHFYLHVPQEKFAETDWLENHLRNITPEHSQLKVIKWKRVREVGPRYIQAVADLEVNRNQTLTF
jgi:tRNA (guanine37-N1)-methyltransferase